MSASDRGVVRLFVTTSPSPSSAEEGRSREDNNNTMEFLHSSKLSGADKGSSTQDHIDVEEIKDGTIVLKNGSLRSVLLVTSINFDLKSSEEQEMIIHQYQNFLNSLDFPLQIVISSRKMNITPYLEYLEGMEKKQTSEILRFQTNEYRHFIKSLVEVSNIMTKSFYVIVPFSPVESQEGGFFQKVTSIFGAKQGILKKREWFETYKNQLWQRVDYVVNGLSGTGVRATQLKTDELIELLYNSYNPNVFTNAIIKDVNKIELNS